MKSPDDISPKARALHFRSIVVDTHDDTTQRMLDPQFDLGARHPDGGWVMVGKTGEEYKGIAKFFTFLSDTDRQAQLHQVSGFEAKRSLIDSRAMVAHVNHRSHLRHSFLRPDLNRMRHGDPGFTAMRAASVRSRFALRS